MATLIATGHTHARIANGPVTGNGPGLFVSGYPETDMTNPTKATLIGIPLIGGIVAMGIITTAKPTDMTANPMPILIDKPTEYGDVVDNCTTRPTFIVVGPNGTLKIKSLTRKLAGDDYASNDDPNLNPVFGEGKLLPRLKISFSSHDFAHSAIVGMGTVNVDVGTVTADVGVMIVANGDGTRGVGSNVHIGNALDVRMGELVTGQDDFTTNIDYARQRIYIANDSVIGGGHVLYCNESYIQDQNNNRLEYLRVRGIKAIIGKIESSPVKPGIRPGASDSVKLKGTWDALVYDLDDNNECGQGDYFNAYGTIIANWKYPKGGTAQNINHLAFRCGDQESFGIPPGNLTIYGSFDHSEAPDQTIRSIALHTLTGHVFMSSVKLNGKARADVYGVVNRTGLFESVVQN